MGSQYQQIIDFSHFCVAQKGIVLHIISMYSGGWLHVCVCVWQCGFPIGGKKQEVISVSNLQEFILLNTNLMYCMDTAEVLNTGRTFLRGTGTVSVHQAVLGMTVSTATGTREVMVCGNPQHCASSS